MEHERHIKYWFYDRTNDVRGSKSTKEEIDRAVETFYEVHGISEAATAEKPPYNQKPEEPKAA